MSCLLPRNASNVCLPTRPIPVYRIPPLMIISYRDDIGEKVACQVEMGIHIKPLFEQLHVPWYRLSQVEEADRDDAILKQFVHVQEAGCGVCRRSVPEERKMNRCELLKPLTPLLKDRLIVCNIGSPSPRLYALLDQPSNFYMLGTTGLCSSTRQGLTPSQEEHIVAINGNVSVLTSFSLFSTIDNSPAGKFRLLIMDNGTYGSTGDQPTYAGLRASLAEVANPCGCEHVVQCAAKKQRPRWKRRSHQI